MSSFRRRLMMTGNKKRYIEFEDPEVERICIANWSSDGVGLTYEDAERVTEINRTHGFLNNTTVVSFNELEYFSNLTHIKEKAFNGCSLININLPKSITYIGTRAFCECQCELIIDLPNLTELAINCFYKSGLLKVLNLGNIKTIGTSMFSQCKKLQILTIPNSVTAISNYLASYADKLIEVTMPDNLESIGIDAFKNALSLTSIRLPGSLKEIGDSFCGSCPAIKDAIVEEGVPYLPFACFSSSVMTKIILPSTIQSIGERCFSSNTLLEDVVIKSITPPTIANNIFNNTPKLTNIYVPDESVEAYKAAENWSAYADKIKPLSEYVES